MVLKNKRVLITAGPTWIPIDKVRVISNIATGQTGMLLADKLQKMGACVTLLLGPVEACCLNKNIRLIPFRFFDDLKNTITKELRDKKYDIVIHSAAVSDYQPRLTYRNKVKSGKKSWRINLVPTPKIIDLIKKTDKSLFVAGFKFEPNAKKARLINETNKLLQSKSCDLVVANTIINNRYRSYVVGKNIRGGPFNSKESLTRQLIKLLVTSY